MNCKVTTDAYVRFAGLLNWFAPLFKQMMTKDFNTLVEELQYRIEFGEPHPEVLKFKKKISLAIPQKGLGMRSKYYRWINKMTVE